MLRRINSVENLTTEFIGKQFGKWTPISLAGRNKYGPFCNCVCECGNTGVVNINKLRSGHSRSCGCLRAEVGKRLLQPDTTTHGASYTPEYSAFVGSKYRCENPKNAAYPYYGGRGIQFRFESFQQFYDEVGPRPSDKHSLDRIDNDGHYEPGNIRWVTKKEQTKNQRRVNDLSFQLEMFQNPIYSYAIC